jgi:broad specificity phosphatase PhoE
MTCLVLCRHAEPGNAQEARALADALRRLPLKAVYTSPLARALETAQTVAHAHGLVATPVDDLREIDFGAVEGLGFDELPEDLQSRLLHEPTQVRFPGGESYAELKDRICGAVDRIVARHPAETIAAISHAGSIRAALAAWLQMADDAVFRLDQRTAAVNVVEWLDGVPIVRLVNAARL